MDFAVWHEGIAEGNGTWVLAVDAAHNRVLLAGQDQSFYWKSLTECQLFKAATPDQPRLVVPVQSQPAPGSIVIPGASIPGNRRNGHN